jgi:hypothetical protein
VIWFASWALGPVWGTLDLTGASFGGRRGEWIEFRESAGTTQRQYRSIGHTGPTDPGPLWVACQPPTDPGDIAEEVCDTSTVIIHEQVGDHR